MRLGLVALVLAGAPLAAQQLTVSDRYAPGDESHWILEVAGEGIGHCWSRYEGEVELGSLRAHHFRAQARLTTEVPGGTLDQRYITELWTDAHAHPLRVEFHASMSDVYSGVVVTFAEGKAQATIDQGGSRRDLEIVVPPESYVLANNFVAHLELLLALAPPEAGESDSYSMLSTNILQVFPLSVERTGEDDSGTVYQDSLGETLVMKAGRLQSLTIAAQQVAFRRVEDPPELFAIDVPGPRVVADLDREEVTIAYADVSLAGTITRPKGSMGNLPAVFFVSGSGGQDRNGFASGIDVGTHEILDRLTEEGFLVLRIDDRGVGESTGPTEDMTYDDLVEDARRCVLFLKQRGDVDAARIVVIGHSEGGQTAPLLAAEIDLAAIVLLAAPGRGILELSHEQFLRGKRLGGASDEELEAFSAAIRAFYAQVIAGEPIDADALPPELRPFVAAQAWMRSHVEQDPVANLQRVRCPVLILQGGKDIQVSAERDAPLLEEALEEAGNPDFELVVFPQLDHLFKRSEEEEPTGLEYLQSRPVDPGFLDTLSAWLAKRLLD
jgi:pimeloyl-ACP methyl ester carboxylesterase